MCYEMCRSTCFTIVSDNDSTITNSSISQNVDIVNLMNNYVSYVCLKNVGNIMIESNKVKLCKLINTCNILEEYIKSDMFILNNPILWETFERLRSILF